MLVKYLHFQCIEDVFGIIVVFGAVGTMARDHYITYKDQEAPICPNPTHSLTHHTHTHTHTICDAQHKALLAE